MKKRSDLKAKTLFIIIIIALLLGVYLGYKIFRTPKTTNKTWILPKINSSKKILTEDALINSIKRKSELITLETTLKEKITLDDSWGNFNSFKKVQNINFYGNGLYCVDLSKVKKEDIYIDNKKDEINITVQKPYVKNITIDENKTEYQTVEKGILRFGEIKLEPSEYQVMLSEAKLRMLNEMRKVDTYNKAEEVSKKSILEFLQGVIQKTSDKKYNINIHFK